MARQLGPIYLVGTLGGVNYYFSEGEPFSRIAGGGFNRDAIKGSANMERVRESNCEFAECSQINKAFKTAMQPFLSLYKDGTLHSRLMQLFLKIKDGDAVSERGKRSVSYGIASESGKRLFKDFVFTPKRSPLLPCEYEFNPDTLTFSVNEFDVNAPCFPDDADYLEVGIGLIRFDFKALSWQRIVADPVVIGRDFKGDSFTVTFREIPRGNGILFSVVRVSFYQTVNGEGILLSDEDAVGIELVAVWDDGKVGGTRKD